MKPENKIRTVMREFKSGELHSGKSGKVVKNPKQAIAIGLSEAGMSKPKMKEAGMKKMKAGGLAAGHKSADGVASKGKTKGKAVKMMGGGMYK